VNLELLLKVSPGLDRENASVRFLTEHVFGSLDSTTTFKERESPENPFFFTAELLWGQADLEGARVQECVAVVTFSTEVQRTGELETHLSHYWNGGQRHQRRWCRQGRCVWHRQRGEISH